MFEDDLWKVVQGKASDLGVSAGEVVRMAVQQYVEVASVGTYRPVEVASKVVAKPVEVAETKPVEVEFGDASERACPNRRCSGHVEVHDDGVSSWWKCSRCPMTGTLEE